MRAILLAILLTGCAGSAKPPLTPAQRAVVALDTSTCLATDVLPGVPALVDHLANQGKVAEQTIFGLIAGIGQVSKSVACYLRAEAAVRMQDKPTCIPLEAGYAPQAGEHVCAPGELVLPPEIVLIRNRAEACDQDCRREQLLARWLVMAEKQGLVAPLVMK